MTDLEALEKAAKAAQKSEGWVTTDWFSVKALEDSICFEPADARFTALASPAAILSLLSAHRAAMEKVERYRDALEAIEDHTETDMDTGETGLSEAAQIARAALTEAP